MPPEDAFTKISSYGSLILDEDFMMTIFSDIVDEVEPFEMHLHFMFKEKASNPVGTRAKEDKVQPYQLLCEELFCPTWKDIQQTLLVSWLVRQPQYFSSSSMIQQRLPVNTYPV
jgi:hypothetical protein